MRKRTIGLAAALSAVLGGCATTPPIEVTRFHLAAPLARGTVAVQPPAGAGPASIEFQTFAAAVQTQLGQFGYTVAPDGSQAQYLATVNFSRISQGVIDHGPPVSIGLGAGGDSFGRRSGFGVGGGVGFGIGRHRTSVILLNELSVRLTDRATGSAVWEGRAQTRTNETGPGVPAEVIANKLAMALFRGFPGESGRTISVR